MQQLFKTIIGSHLWKMDRPDSDIDEFIAYIVPTKDILSGILRQNSHFTSGDRDVSRHEIGVVIEQLLKGNINFITGVMSNLIVFNKNHHLNDLRYITMTNVSKNCYNSIRGLSIANHKKFIHSGILTGAKLQKKLDLVMRTINLGITLMDTGKIRFEPVYDTTEEDVQAGLTALDISYSDSKLPARPDEKPFRDYLFELRLKELKGLSLRQKLMELIRNVLLFTVVVLYLLVIRYRKPPESPSVDTFDVRLNRFL